MKKRWVLLLSFILVLQICGFRAPVYGAETAAAGSGGPVGIWKLIEMTSNGETAKREDLEMYESMGMVAYMEVRGDNTFTLSFFGSDTEGTWDDVSFVSEGDPIPYTLDKEVLTLEKDDTAMKFERTTLEAIYAILGYRDDVLDKNVQYSKDPQTLLDTDDVTVKITGYKADLTGFTATIHCENKTEHKMLISSKNDFANKYKIQPIWAFTLEAKESKDTDYVIKPADLAKCGISAVDEILLDVTVIDEDTWDVLADSGDIAVYPTGKKPEEIKAPDRTPVENEKILADTDDFTFIMQGGGEDPVYGYVINCYFENKTDKPLTFMWSKTSVNQTDTSFYYADESLPGTRGYSKGFIMKNELEEKEIEEVKELGFTLQVYNSDSYEKVFEEAFTYEP
ncbi:MAG: hypothetical protein Q4D81_11330 [Eubacteriales bacterium]|nr:hypothetical protein [Eubacteriales bacterium]